MAVSIGTIKRGASFSVPMRLHPVHLGQPQLDLSDWTIESQIRRDNGTLIDDLAIDWIDVEERTISIQATPEQTAEWPISRLLIDVKITSPDQEISLSSRTMEVKVEQAITR